MTIDKRILIRTIDKYELILASEEDVAQFNNKHTVETVSIGDANIQYVSESYDVWRDRGIVSSPSGAHGYLVIHKVSTLEKVVVRPYGAYFGDLYDEYRDNETIHYFDYYGYDIPLSIPPISVIGGDFTLSTDFRHLDENQEIPIKKLISSTNIGKENSIFAKIAAQAEDYSDKFGNLDNSLQAASLLIARYLKDAGSASAKAISVTGESAGKVGTILKAVSEFADFAGAVMDIPSTGPGRELYEAGANAIASLLVAGAVGQFVTVSGASVLLAPILGGVAAPIVVGLAVAFVVDSASGPIIESVVKYSFDNLYENSYGPGSHAAQQMFSTSEVVSGGSETFISGTGLLDQPPKIDWKLDLGAGSYTSYNDEMLNKVEYNKTVLGFNAESNIINADYDYDRNILIGGFGSDKIIGGDQGDIIIGSFGDDLITPNEGSDIIDGGDGVDTVILSDFYSDYEIDDSGNYIYFVNKISLERSSFSAIEVVKFADDFEYRSKTVFGTIKSDKINGNKFNNRIDGMNGDDWLDGMLGADTMIGGAGNDTYIVDNTRDVILENGNKGYDRVVTSVSYALANNVEMLTLAGTKAINATGNASANHLVGNGAANILDGKAGADVMEGGAGNDIYVVDHASDRVVEVTGEGRDTVVTTVSYKLAAGQQIEILQTKDASGTAALKLTGNEFGNKLVGNAGNNVLEGGAGIDEMRGGAGNDTYAVDNARDLVVEAVGGGTDTVMSRVSYALKAGQEIESLRLTSTAGSANLTGNEFGQSLVGNAGVNVLNGGLGADVLTGGKGADTFVFSTALGADNVDQITEFSTVDTIRLSKSIFSALAPGELKANEFKDIAKGKVDADDHILYDSRDGSLFYDADGSGKAAAVKFAILDNKAAITHADFLTA